MCEVSAPEPDTNKTVGQPPENREKLKAAMATRLLADRLKEEGETELWAKINDCGKPISLTCMNCGRRKEVANQCKRKWCPCCARLLAARRSAELRHIVRHFRWPLHVTLTMKNVSSITPAVIKILRRSFGKLRHRKMWTACTRAGVATVEVTNRGNGWHPHVHAVIDCEWLAWHTPMPPRRAGEEAWKQACRAAKMELEATWAKILKQPTASVDARRCDREEITKEIVKYAVKGSDLIECVEPIGDLIRALEGTRLMTTFGRAHGQCVKELRKQAQLLCKKELIEWQEKQPPQCECGNASHLPTSVLERSLLKPIH